MAGHLRGRFLAFLSSLWPQLWRLQEETLAAKAETERAYEELQERYLQARELNRLKDEFLAVVSHELRMPLTKIIGFTDLLLSQEVEVSPDQHQEFLEIILNEGLAQLRLIEDLLECTRAQACTLRIRPRSVSLPASLSAVLQLVEPESRAKELEMVLNVADDVPFVKVDPARLQQILRNLLSNAIKFTSTGGCITVTARTWDDHQVAISVSDTGVGISSQNLRRIFTRFWQVEPAISRQYGGLGLGLTIVKSLVELHGGTIWAESAEGQGTTFTFTLPIASLVKTTIPLGCEEVAGGTPQKQ